MKNSLVDLNNHLFAELERLGDEDIAGEQLEDELKRAKAISCVANQVIQNGKLVLAAAKFQDERLDADASLPRMLVGEK